MGWDGDVSECEGVWDGMGRSDSVCEGVWDGEE